MTSIFESKAILIVDDNPTNLEVLSEALTSAGFRVAVALDRESAIKQVKYRPPETIKVRLFDPLFTTKAVGKGTGLDLAISYKIIVEQHQGDLQCTSIAGEGTEFAIAIPLRQSVVSSRLPFNLSLSS
jgi:nitrogen-specific signal transduction histidine kinase